jgi:hypothetical protein
MEIKVFELEFNFSNLHIGEEGGKSPTGIMVHLLG